MIDTLRRLVVALVALATVLVPALVLSAPAGAATSAPCKLIVPSRVAISQPYHGFRLRSEGCLYGQESFAAWEAYHPSQGLQAQVVLGGSQVPVYWNLYAYSPTGRITWRPAGAYVEADGFPRELAQNTPTTDVRYASRATLKAVRTGATVTLTATARRYDLGQQGFVAWRSAHAEIQYRTPGNTTWITLRRVTTGRDGSATWSRRDWATREYRVVVSDRSSVWGSTSLLTRR